MKFIGSIESVSSLRNGVSTLPPFAPWKANSVTIRAANGESILAGARNDVAITLDKLWKQYEEKGRPQPLETYEFTFYTITRNYRGSDGVQRATNDIYVTSFKLLQDNNHQECC